MICGKVEESRKTIEKNHFFELKSYSWSPCLSSPILGAKKIILRHLGKDDSYQKL